MLVLQNHSITKNVLLQTLITEFDSNGKAKEHSSLLSSSKFCKEGVGDSQKEKSNGPFKEKQKTRGYYREAKKNHRYVSLNKFYQQDFRTGNGFVNTTVSKGSGN